MANGEFVWSDNSVSPNRAAYDARVAQLQREAQQAQQESHRAHQADLNRLAYQNRKMQEAQRAQLDANREMMSAGDRARQEREERRREYMRKTGATLM
jgi:hypothetical protein